VDSLDVVDSVVSHCIECGFYYHVWNNICQSHLFVQRLQNQWKKWWLYLDLVKVFKALVTNPVQNLMV